jgi:PEP-CTERM motif
MKRLLLLAPVLLLLSVSACADSVTMDLFPSDGSSDNFSFFEQGNGFQVIFSGETPFGSSFFRPQYAPGAIVGGLTNVFTATVLIKINGVPYDVRSFSFAPELFIFPFTLPTNGKDFTINTEAFFAFSAILYNGQTFDVFGAAPGKMRFTFGNGIYTTQPVRLSTVPEPSTLGLLATGILALAKRFARG